MISIPTIEAARNARYSELKKKRTKGQKKVQRGVVNIGKKIFPKGKAKNREKGAVKGSR